jgi:uncharacterized membrane protein HdeD (DUF308 family)
VTGVNVNLSQTQWFGLGGVAALVVGLFAPLYSVLGFSATLVSMGWPAAVTGVAALAAAAFIVRRQGWWALGAAGVAAAVVLYVFITVEMGISNIDDQISAAGSGNEFVDEIAEGLGDMAHAALSPQWGWAVIGLGLLAVMFSSVALAMGGRDRGPSA